MSTKKTTVSIDEKILADFDFMAETLEMTRNRVIVDALEEYIKSHTEQAKAIRKAQEELQKAKAQY